jgi:HK97 family phage major capsid protein
MNLKETQQKITAEREALAKLFADHTVTAADGSTTYKFSGDQLTEINQRKDALNALCEEYEQAKGLDDLAKENEKGLKELSRVERPSFSGDPEGETERASKNSRVFNFGESVVASKAYEAWKQGRQKNVAAEFPFEVKTLFQTSAGWDPYPERQDRVELTAERPLLVSALPAFGETTSDTIEYWEETTATMNAAEIAEAGAYPEDAYVLTLRTDSVKKIGTTIPATEEQLDDESRARTYLENRIRRSVQARLDTQILTGDGAGANLTGILNHSIQSQAKGADDHYSAVFKAITKVMESPGFAIPDYIVEHPNDWQDVVLMKDADGRFIWGQPSDNPTRRLWGIPVVVTPAITENTALVGDFKGFSELIMRKAIEVVFTDSNEDDFKKDKILIKARLRAALAVYRLNAFCKVTGL